MTTPLPIPSEALVDRLRQALPTLMAVYAFGSQIHGTAGPDSDLDLAVLLPGHADPVVLWELAGALRDVAGCPVDLVDLRAASTVLQYQVLAHGQRWWTRDRQAGMWEASMLSHKTDLDSARAPLMADIAREGRIHARWMASNTTRDNSPMTPRPPLPFTKMHGLGNDFVVLDATRAPLDLSEADLRFLGDRRFGIGADQILVVEPARASDADFRYRIFNGATGEEVEHCGNGARCFMRYVRDHGLTDRDTVRVETMNNRIVLAMTPDGRVTVDMNQPIFEAVQIPFDPTGLTPRMRNGFELWPLTNPADPTQWVEIAAVSMGNPHAVQRVEDVDTAPVATVGPWVEAHASFPRKVNAGFLQIVDRGHVRLRVHERGAGETLACGTGACAAVVAGIRLGWLDAVVEVETRGGRLTIAWDGIGHSVRMTGPAVTVFDGTVAFPD